MDDEDIPEKPTMTDAAKRAADQKARRLADALKENLRRRKAQTRGRADSQDE